LLDVGRRSNDYTAGCVRGLSGSIPDNSKKQLDNRQGALADGLHGLNPRNTALFNTREQKANSVDYATVKATGTTVEQGQMYKRSNPSCALGAFCVFNAIKSLEREGRVSSIHPWGNYG